MINIKFANTLLNKIIFTALFPWLIIAQLLIYNHFKLNIKIELHLNKYFN